MSFIDSIKSHLPADMFTEDDPVHQLNKPANPTATVRLRPADSYVPSAVPTTPPTANTNPQLASEDQAGVNQLLDELKQKTDFDNTPIGKLIQEKLATLDGLDFTAVQKMGVVIKTGQKEGITAEAIIKTLNGLKVVLDQDQTDFSATVEKAIQDEIESRKASISNQTAIQEDLKAKLAASVETQSVLANEIVTIQTNISRKSAQYNTAYTSRSIQLDNDISHYTSLLNSIPAQGKS